MEGAGMPPSQYGSGKQVLAPTFPRDSSSTVVTHVRLLDVADSRCWVSLFRINVPLHFSNSGWACLKEEIKLRA